MSGPIGYSLGGASGILGSLIRTQSEIDRIRQERDQSARIHLQQVRMHLSSASSACSTAATINYVNEFPNHAGLMREPKINTEQQAKAEKKALLLFQNLYGTEQCDIYRTNRLVRLKPAKHWWIIGNLMDSYRENYPFSGKPDVARVDNPKKQHVTLFCVAQKDAEPTPYTDKVISFATHLKDDEKAFIKTVNRMRETTITNLAECAVI